MSFTFSSFQALLIPLIAVFGVIGWQRGFWREVGSTGGMALVILATVLFPEQFIGFINQIIIKVPRVFGVLLSRDDIQALPADLLFGDPTSGRYLLARIALFVLLVFLVYSARFGWSFEGGKWRVAKTPSENLMGGLFGGITGFLWFVALNNFLNILRTFRSDPVLPPEGTTITVPTIEDVSPLLGFVPTLVAILIIVLAVLAALRLPRLWSDGGKK